MNDSIPLAATTLVPASTVLPLAVAGKESLSPALALQRLTPHQVIDVWPNKRIYYFLKVGAKPGTSIQRLDPETARQVAMLTVDRAKNTFKLAWYPWQEKPQVFTELPIERLYEAIEDMRGAGFR